LNEAQHREIQRLRSNAEELVRYLRQQNLLFALNHFRLPSALEMIFATDIIAPSEDLFLELIF
jgi:hypothetical protein